MHNTARKAAKSELKRLAYISPMTVTIPPGGFLLVGATGTVADWLRARRIARRRASDCSFGSGRRFDWTSMTKAELTAENKPAYENELDNSKAQEALDGDDARKSRQCSGPRCTS